VDYLPHIFPEDLNLLPNRWEKVSREYKCMPVGIVGTIRA